MKKYIATLLAILLGVIGHSQSQSLLHPINYLANSAYNANDPRYEDNGIRLTDGIVGVLEDQVWSGWLNYTNGSNPFIQPSIVFNFDQYVSIDTVNIFFSRNDLAAVFLPQYVIIGSDTFSLAQNSIADHASGWLTFSGNWTGNSINVKTDGYYYSTPLNPYSSDDFTFIAEVTFSGVPEPSALSLLAVGLGGLAMLRRRRS